MVCAAALAMVACGGGGSSTSSFCNAAKSLRTKYGENPGADILGDRTKAQQALNDFKQVASKAPSEIKSDVNTLVDAFQQAVNQDLAGLQQNEVKYSAASDHLTAFLRDKCGINTSTSVSSGAVGTTTVPVTTGSGSEGNGSGSATPAICHVGQQLRARLGSATVNNPTGYHTLADALRSAAGDAPASVKPDLQTIADTLDKIGNGDVTAIANQSFQSAVQHVETYLVQSCAPRSTTSAP
jgi:hypothetical protein